MALIVIDPGHGGSDPGKVGPAGTFEKTYALDVGKRTAGILNPDHRAEMTRRDDTFVELADRPATAKRLKADVFVSIHFNSNGPSAQGTETYKHPDSTSEDTRLAEAVQDRVVAATGHNDRGVKEANFVVIRPTLHYVDTRSCLVEVSFLSNAAEETRLGDPDYRQEIAQAIADGVEDFLAEDRKAGRADRTRKP
ncbi:MAG: N-acetylmuramoyl-L-alanine amidase [Pirellulales bacterium]|nr:N-acetylmuramoyl-L-alanine amidase [Pirellulales bacterium]